MIQTLAITGVSTEGIVSTLVYALIGVVIMLLSILFVNAVFGLELKKELASEHNMAFGILFAGVAIGLSIIIAASIV